MYYCSGIICLYLQCTKKHVLECEEYTKNGVCSKGPTCKMVHHKIRKKRRRSVSLSGSRKPRAFLQKRRIVEDPVETKNDLPTGAISPLKNKGLSFFRFKNNGLSFFS